MTLDLRQQADLEKFWELVESCDVLVENFSPRVMENFGLTREALWERQPGLLIVSLSAFGQTGPYRDYVGYGPTLESMAGLASLTGYGDGIPWLPGFSVSDMGAGIHGAFALLGALYSHRQDGRGIAIDLSQYEAAVQLSGDYIMEGTFSTELQKTTGSRCVADLKEFGPVLETEMNGGGRSIAAPWSSSGDPVRLYEPAPELGQHNLFLDDFIKKKTGCKFEYKRRKGDLS